MPWQSRITPPRTVLAGAVVAAIVYCRDVRYDFISDDVPLVLMNETIMSWRNVGFIFRNHIFSSKYGTPNVFAHYRPVYMLWLMLNNQLFGKVLPWWHLTSLLLHMAVTLLVYLAGAKILKEPWTAALAALLFAFHPIHAESVSYVTASTDLLVALFGLVSFLLYAHFREQEARPVFLVTSIFAAALAMLSKENGAMLPWVLFSYEVFRKVPRDGGPRWKRFALMLPYFVVVAAYGVARYLLFGNNGPGGSRWSALVDIPLVLVVYVCNFLWPRRLSFYYPVEWTSQWTLVKGVAVVLILGLGVFLWNRYRERPGVQLQILWAAILFAPLLLAAQMFGRDDWIHDRHMYLASIPLCLILAILLRDSALSQKTSLAASALVLAALLLGTTAQVPRFSDGIAVFQSALEVAPRNVTAHRFYAIALSQYGRQEEALQQFHTIVELSPESAPDHESYADSLAEIGRNREALVEYAEALRYAPPASGLFAGILYRMAAIEADHSQLQTALGHLSEALRIDPHNAVYHRELAKILAQQGQTQEANLEIQLATKIQTPAIPNISRSQ
jgi:Flp pilus assembly protein TadD